MLRLQDIMTRDVVRLEQDMTLREALEILTTRHISGAPVVDGDRVVGVFSAMNAIEFLATTPAGPDVDEDDEPPQIGDPADPQAEAPAAFFVDYWGDARPGTPGRPGGALAWDLLAEHTVAEAMNRAYVALAPGADARAAADAMQRAQSHRVLVIEHGRLLGIVSALDIARAVAEHKLDSRRYVYTAGPL